MKNGTTTQTAIREADTSNMIINKASTSRVNQVDLENPGFGKVFSDHMFSMDYRDGQWQPSQIIPFGKIEILPSLATLHYGQALFEGMKAFRDNNGGVNIFRPEEHQQRINKSCRRMCIPEIDENTFIGALEELIRLDHNWVPTKRGNALYIRPFAFATDEDLSVKASNTYKFLIITSPVGAYYKEGINPVSLITPDNYVRSVKGSTGDIKAAGNYGPTILPARQAKENGFTQVLWLDAIEHKYVEEVGTMNIFFKINDRLITPPLEGSILGGITRDSVIHLANDWGIPIEERRISIDEVFEASTNGTLQEAFGTGTAAVISPVGRIQHNGKVLTTDEEKIGSFAKKLYDEITGIQYGERPDHFGWLHHVKTD